MRAHPRNESKGAKLERESQRVIPPPLGTLDDVGGHRVMAQQGGDVRNATVIARSTDAFPFSVRFCPPTGIDPNRDKDL